MGLTTGKGEKKTLWVVRGTTPVCDRDLCVRDSPVVTHGP